MNIKHTFTLLASDKKGWSFLLISFFLKRGVLVAYGAILILCAGQAFAQESEHFVQKLASKQVALPTLSSAIVSPGSNEKATPKDSESSEILKLLRDRYADPSAIKEAQTNKGSLESLLHQLGGGASILNQATALTQNPKPVYMELLSQNIGYIRMPSFAFPKDRLAFEMKLVEWERLPVLGLILDVRDFEAMPDYGGAAQLLSFFTKTGVNLFTLQGIQMPQRVYSNERRASTFSRPIIVLVNGSTSGAGEVFAAAMRSSAKAIVMGRSTAGLAALFADMPLSSGHYLHLATGQAFLADGTKLFGNPLTPDIAVVTDEEKEKEQLSHVADLTAAKLIQELPPRIRMTEAALVRDENPEYEAAIAERTRGRVSSKTNLNLQDQTLIRALDVLHAIQLTDRLY